MCIAAFIPSAGVCRLIALPALVDMYSDAMHIYNVFMVVIQLVFLCVLCFVFCVFLRRRRGSRRLLILLALGLFCSCLFRFRLPSTGVLLIG